MKRIYECDIRVKIFWCRINAIMWTKNGRLDIRERDRERSDATENLALLVRSFQIKTTHIWHTFNACFQAAYREEREVKLHYSVTRERKVCPRARRKFIAVNSSELCFLSLVGAKFERASARDLTRAFGMQHLVTLKSSYWRQVLPFNQSYWMITKHNEKVNWGVSRTYLYLYLCLKV